MVQPPNHSLRHETNLLWQMKTLDMTLKQTACAELPSTWKFLICWPSYAQEKVRKHTNFTRHFKNWMNNKICKLKKKVRSAFTNISERKRWFILGLNMHFDEDKTQLLLIAVSYLRDRGGTKCAIGFDNDCCCFAREEAGHQIIINIWRGS